MFGMYAPAYSVQIELVHYEWQTLKCVLVFERILELFEHYVRLYVCLAHIMYFKQLFDVQLALASQRWSVFGYGH